MNFLVSLGVPAILVSAGALLDAWTARSQRAPLQAWMERQLNTLRASRTRDYPRLAANGLFAFLESIFGPRPITLGGWAWAICALGLVWWALTSLAYALGTFLGDYPYAVPLGHFLEYAGNLPGDVLTLLVSVHVWRAIQRDRAVRWLPLLFLDLIAAAALALISLALIVYLGAFAVEHRMPFSGIDRPQEFAQMLEARGERGASRLLSRCSAVNVEHLSFPDSVQVAAAKFRDALGAAESVTPTRRVEFVLESGGTRAARMLSLATPGQFCASLTTLLPTVLFAALFLVLLIWSLLLTLTRVISIQWFRVHVEATESGRFLPWTMLLGSVGLVYALCLRAIEAVIG